MTDRNFSHRPRKALLNRPDIARVHLESDQRFRGVRRNRPISRNTSQFSFSNRSGNGVSKFSENGRSALISPRSQQQQQQHQTPLNRMDPVLAAAAAMMNAGLMAPNPSVDFAALSGGSNSQTNSAVAAVAAAAMNAAMAAAALGVGNNNMAPGRSFSQSIKSLGNMSGVSNNNHNRSNQNSSGRTSHQSSVSQKRQGGRSRTPRSNQTYNRSRESDAMSARFPHHLDHRNPEDDPTATRTLFVGNLMPEITEADLRNLFERYGFIEDIDIKRRDLETGTNAFAFIRFINLDMAHRAKVDMSGQMIGQFACKIGYGKVVPTRCIWVGGLGPWINYPQFANLVEEFGPTERIIWPSGKNYANILFPTIEMAKVAADALRGYPLGGENRKIRVDFTDEAHMIRDPLKRRRFIGSTNTTTERPTTWNTHARNDRAQTTESSDDACHRRRGKRQHRSGSIEDRGRSTIIALTKNDPPRRPNRPMREAVSPKRRCRRSASPGMESPSTSKHNVKLPKVNPYESNNSPPFRSSHAPLSPQSAMNVDQLASCLPPAWDGVFFLKSSSFPCRMHMLRGDQSLVDQFMSYQPTDNQRPDPVNGSSEQPSGCLRITQRMKLDPLKLDDVSQRINTAGNSGFCVLLAVSAPTSVTRSGESSEVNKQHQRPLRNLVSYLRTKDSAGVVLLSPTQPTTHASNDGLSVTGVLHAFPPCDFAFDLLRERAVCLKKDFAKDDHLVILLIRSTGTM